MGTVISIFIGAAILGVIFGPIGRLIVPGKHRIPIGATMMIGFGGALIGGIVAEIIGVRQTAGIDWTQYLLQAGFSAAGVVAYVRRNPASRRSIAP